MEAQKGGGLMDKETINRVHGNSQSVPSFIDMFITVAARFEIYRSISEEPMKNAVYIGTDGIIVNEKEV